MAKYNLNDNVILYPNQRGWAKIVEITQNEYNLTQEQVAAWVHRRKECGGFKEQLWVVMSVYHEMFFNGQQYFETAFIDLLGEVSVG